MGAGHAAAAWVISRRVFMAAFRSRDVQHCSSGCNFSAKLPRNAAGWNGHISAELGSPFRDSLERNFNAAAGLEIWPRGIYDLVTRISKDYNNPVIEITESGCSYLDEPYDKENGRIPDARRIHWYRQVLAELARAISDGANVRAFHAWSLLDNFQWGEGFMERYGLIHTDFRSQNVPSKIQATGTAALPLPIGSAYSSGKRLILSQTFRVACNLINQGIDQC